MTTWRQPQAGEKGDCRIRPHKSKTFESGYKIMWYKGSDPTLAMVSKSGTSFMEWVPVSNIEVPA